MPIKKTIPKKNARQKKLLHTVAHPPMNEEHAPEDSLEGREDAIKKQFKIIQKDYFKLMLNVTKGYDLVKGWLESQAIQKRDMLKSRLIKI